MGNHSRPKRDFWLLDRAHQPTGRIFRSASPRGAALKAAARGYTEIILFEKDRLWLFEGERHPKPKTHYTALGWAGKMGITLWSLYAQAKGSVALDLSTAKKLEQTCFNAQYHQESI